MLPRIALRMLTVAALVALLCVGPHVLAQDAPEGAREQTPLEKLTEADRDLQVQIAQLREFLVDARAWAPIVVVDAYWDAEGQAVCPAATGISKTL